MKALTLCLVLTMVFTVFMHGAPPASSSSILLNDGRTLQDARIVAIGETTVSILHGSKLETFDVNLVPLDDLARAHMRLEAAANARAKKAGENKARTADQITTRGALKAPAIPSHQQMLAALAASFVEKTKQIPATVIDLGPLRYVPYLSYRVGEDREVNVYGDPAAPACVEIGLYRTFLDSESEKRRCISYLQGTMPGFNLSGVPLKGGQIVRGSMVLEITPPDAPDAYGGWWISVYDLALLESSRASVADINAISVPRESAAREREWNASEMTYARPAYQSATSAPRVMTSPGTAASNNVATATSPTARTTTPSHSSSASSSFSHGSGRVYVKGYTRKDGTYVRPHSRRR